MAKAPATVRGRVEALLGSGWMVSLQERKDILALVEGLEHRIEVVEAQSESLDVGRAGVMRAVYDRLTAVMDEPHDAPGPVGAFWIGACVGVVLTMIREEEQRHGD